MAGWQQPAKLLYIGKEENMTKKITAILLSIIMTITFMPTMAFATLPEAADKYTNSIVFTTSDEATSNAKYAWTPISGDAIPWNTLTLKSGFNMVISSDASDVFGIKVPDNTYLNIAGNSSITMETTANPVVAISAEGNLFIQGSAKLTIKVASGNAIEAGTYINKGSAQITGGTLTNKVLKPTNNSNPVVIDLAGINVNPGTGGTGSTGGKIENDKLTLTYLDTYKITASSSTGAGLNFKSSNDKVVTVATDGTVKAVGAGSATITLTDKNNTSITKTLDVTVNAKSLTSTMVSAIADQEYTGAYINPVVTVKDGTTTLVKDTDYTVTYSNNKEIASKSSGKAPTATVTGKGNYTGSVAMKFNIVSPYNVTIEDTVLGKTPKVSVVVAGVALVENTHYTVTFKDNNKIGYATAVIAGKGTYAGLSKEVKFRIIPNKSAITKLTVGKKKVTVKWNEITGVDGYYIRYSTSKSFSSSKKVKISDPEIVKKTIKSLKKGKKYYVKVRAFKNVTTGTKTEPFYANWSTIKRTAKIK